jgi:hypothetical protein
VPRFTIHDVFFTRSGVPVCQIVMEGRRHEATATRDNDEQSCLHASHKRQTFKHLKFKYHFIYMCTSNIKPIIKLTWRLVNRVFIFSGLRFMLYALFSVLHSLSHFGIFCLLSNISKYNIQHTTTQRCETASCRLAWHRATCANCKLQGFAGKSGMKASELTP